MHHFSSQNLAPQKQKKHGTSCEFGWIGGMSSSGRSIELSAVRRCVVKAGVLSNLIFLLGFFKPQKKLLGPEER